MHANQTSMIIHLVKKVAQIDHPCILEHQMYSSFSDCKCNPDGSKTLECDDVNGDCTCKEGFTGSKCDECKPNFTGDKCDTCDETFFNYPSCQGLFLKKIIYGFLKINSFLLS